MSSKIGVDTDALQQLLFTFSQAGIDAQTVETALTQWGKRIGEAYTQGGPLAELLKANNVSLTDGEGKLRSSVDLLADMADLIKNAGSEQERLAIAAVAFNKAGAEMVPGLKDGAAALRAGANEATRLGIVLDKEVLARAAVLDDEFDKIATVIDIQIKSGLLNVADAIGVAIEFVRDWQAEIQELSKYIAAIPVIGPLSVAKDALSGGDAPTPGRVGLAVGGKTFGTPAPLSDATFNSRFSGPQKTIVPGKGEGGIDFSSSGSMRRGGRARELVDPWEDLREAAHDYSEELDDINSKYEEMNDIGRDVLGGFISDIKSGTSATEALANALDRVGDRLLDMALDGLFSSGKKGGGGFLGSLFSGLFGKGGGGGLLSKVGLFHQGGIVGQGGSSRMVSPLAFAGAQRMHSGGMPGLRADEVPAILQRGEMVLPRGAKRGGGQETINVVLRDDSGRMADIADQRIQTASGTIVRVSVQQSTKAVDKRMPGLMANAQARSL